MKLPSKHGKGMRRHWKKIFLTALSLLVIYIGSFAIWWLRSPRGIAYPFDGQPCPYIRLRYDPLLWTLWAPCLTVMEDFGGWPIRGCEAMASKVVYVDGYP